MLVVVQEMLHGFGQCAVVLAARGVGVPATVENLVSKDIHAE